MDPTLRAYKYYLKSCLLRFGNNPQILNQLVFNARNLIVKNIKTTDIEKIKKIRKELIDSADFIRKNVAKIYDKDSKRVFKIDPQHTGVRVLKDGEKEDFCTGACICKPKK
ncbi:hypothetical protein MHBO_001412 [Bonamia ostreae]|uniref:Uncharacterized protein n=1 Tax=Bonamia ostreae TaxID=126728 RepID=A0ABV2AK32_9EUKA